MADAPPAPSGELLTHKYGPLPVWGYMGIGLAVVLAWRIYAGHKSASDDTGSGATSTASPKTISSGYQLPSNMPPQFPTVNEDTYNANINSNNTSTVNNPTPAPVVTPPVVPSPPVVPVPAPPEPSGKYITIIPAHKHDTNKDPSPPSSLWGVSSTAYGTGKMARDIWNDPKNAALVAKRGKPENLQVGDQLWVQDRPKTFDEEESKKPAKKPSH